ncbi:hypothetical protein HXZ93_01450 [Acinetobacter pseudolwoffii]|nr:hypothetical protein [Acinetobacter pseudolwoffii]
MMKNNIVYYFVEGECEDHFIKHAGLMGRIIKLDLSERNEAQINKLLTNFPRNKKHIALNIVFDTDVLINDRTKLERFITNIRFLKKGGYILKLLQQHKNFEEELFYSLRVNKQRLFEKFSARNDREFKQNFIADKKPYTKLQEINPDFLFWSSEHICELTEFENLMCKFSSLTKKPQ